MNKLNKLIELENKVIEGLTKKELIELRKKVYNIRVELYSEVWYRKHYLLKCIKEFIDEDDTSLFDEVIKEWEENNCTVKIEKEIMTITDEKGEIDITVDLIAKELWNDKWINYKQSQKDQYR